MIPFRLIFRFYSQLFFICFFNSFFNYFIQFLDFVSQFLVYVFQLFNLHTAKNKYLKYQLHLLFFIFRPIIILLSDRAWTAIYSSMWTPIIVNLIELIFLFLNILLFLTMRHLWVLSMTLRLFITLLAVWVTAFLGTYYLIFILLCGLNLMLSITLFVSVLLNVTNHFNAILL